jgi:hypothetical protein
MSVKIYDIQLYSTKGIQWDIDIWDTQASTGSSTSLDALDFSIDYDAGLTDNITSPIVSSSVSVTVNSAGILNTFLNNLKTSEENRYLMKVKKDSSFYWAGIILQDFSGQEDLDHEGITLQATDGLATLKDIDYIEQGTTPSTIYSFFNLALNEIPTEEFWTISDLFLRTKINWYDTRIGSTLDPCLETRFDADVFQKIETVNGYNNKRITKIENWDWYSVLEHITSRFNARLMLIRGAWTLVQIQELKNSSITFYAYTKNSAATIESVTIRKEIDGTNLFRGGGNFYYFPGLKKTRVRFLSPDGGDISPVSDLEMDTLYTLRDVETASSNYLIINGKILYTCSIDSVGSLPYREPLYFNLTIRVGSYYFTNSGWQASAGFYNVQATSVQENISDFIGRPIFSTCEFLFNTDSIPVDGTVYIKAELDTSKGVGADIGSSLTQISEELLKFNVLYSIGGSNPAEYVQWTTSNSDNYNLTLELDDSLFGSSGSQAAKGYLYTRSGASWDYAGLWGIGAGTKDKRFNEILSRTVLEQQGTPLITWSGDLGIIDKSYYIDFLSSPYFSYNSNVIYFLTNRLTYSAKGDTWSGDIVELSSASLTLSSDSTEQEIQVGGDLIGGIVSQMQGYLDETSGEIDTQGSEINMGGGNLNTENGEINTGTGTMTAGGTVKFSGLESDRGAVNDWELYYDETEENVKIKIPE